MLMRSGVGTYFGGGGVDALGCFGDGWRWRSGVRGWLKVGQQVPACDARAGWERRIGWSKSSVWDHVEG